MKTLLLIPSVLKKNTENDVAADKHPVMDYFALADGLKEKSGDIVEIIDFSALDADTHPFVSFVRKLGGRDAGLAAAGFVRRSEFDVIFTNGENIGIPLALLFKTTPKRPGHVTIGHRLSTGKKRLFFTVFKAHRQIDTIFVYAKTQLDFGLETLKIPKKSLSLIPFHADAKFYRPLTNVTVKQEQICSAGLEWRDYPTLIDAVEPLPDITVKLAAASPWSKHTDETAGRALPANIDARRYEYAALRTLYAESSFVVVPLYENDFQAGVTTILEAMAMAKAVIVSRTTGQTDVVIDGVTGLNVPPGDASALRQAIVQLREDSDLRAKLGASARTWLEQNASLDRWVDNIVKAVWSAGNKYGRN
jgi:glycosyltransferase involved in cell wall biosynthesis